MQGRPPLGCRVVVIVTGELSVLRASQRDAWTQFDAANKCQVCQTRCARVLKALSILAPRHMAAPWGSRVGIRWLNGLPLVKIGLRMRSWTTCNLPKDAATINQPCRMWLLTFGHLDFYLLFSFAQWFCVQLWDRSCIMVPWTLSCPPISSVPRDASDG